MFIIRKRLSPDEVTPAGTRYNSGTDTVQTTSDGGATWNDAPGLDPRHADSFRNPVLTTADPQCDAAANMVAFLHSVIDADIAAANTIAMSTAFIGLVTLFFPVLLVADLILAVAGIIAAIGSTALSEAFTSTVYDDLLCTFYNHLETDGSMTAADLSALLADIFANYDSVVFDAIDAHNKTLYEVGWSNAGAAGSETGDCTSCTASTCYEILFSDGEPLFTTIISGNWDATNLWFDQTCVGGAGSDSLMQIAIAFTADTTTIALTRVEVDVDIITLGSHIQIYCTDATPANILLGEDDYATGVQTIGFDVTSSDTFYQFYFTAQTTAGCGVADVHYLAMRIFSDDLATAGLTSNC